jgi:ribokinase
MDLIFRTPRMPGVGETMSGYAFAQVAGGKGANQAVAAARQGGRVSLVACVGNDAYSQQMLSALKQDHIDTQYIHTLPDCATGVAGIFVDDQGGNSIVVAPGANAQLTPHRLQIAQAAICNAQLLICQCETPLTTIQAAVDMAHAHGVQVIFNPAPATPLPDALFTKVDYLIVNEIEAEQLTQRSTSHATIIATWRAICPADKGRSRRLC